MATVPALLEVELLPSAMLSETLALAAWPMATLWKAVAERFSVQVELHPSIKEADNAVLLAEAAQIMGPKPAPWNIEGEPADIQVTCMAPTVARAYFLARFYHLVGLQP